MPTYEYACRQCGEHMEIVQSFKDDALTVCPNCGGALRKVFGSIGISFRGSGFYRTDSRPAAKSSTKSESAESTTSESKSSESKSESSKSSADGGSKSSDGSGAKSSSSDSGTKSTPAAKTA